MFTIANAILTPLVAISIASNGYCCLARIVRQTVQKVCAKEEKEGTEFCSGVYKTQSQSLEKAFALVFAQYNLLAAFLCRTLTLSIHKACSPLCATLRARKRQRDFLTRLNS